MTRKLFVYLPTDEFVCAPCAVADGIALEDPDVEVWEEGSDGWLAEVGNCARCAKPIPVLVDVEDTCEG